MCLQRLEELVKKGWEEKSYRLNASYGNLLEALNKDEEAKGRVNKDGYIKVAPDKDQNERKREKLVPFYDRPPDTEIKFSNVRLEDYKPGKTAVPRVKAVYYEDEKKAWGIIFKKPKKEDEMLSKEEIIQKIMKGFEYCRQPDDKMRPYIVEIDDILHDDTSTFGRPVNDLGTPIELLVGNGSAGITIPYRYVGTEYSVFPLHIEDLHGVNSYNEIVCGAIKVWMVIKKEYYGTLVLKMNNYLRKYCHVPVPDDATKAVISNAQGKLRVAQTCIILHKLLWLDPELLMDWDIPFRIVIQRAGEVMITGPNAFHQGFNLGDNYATSVNLILDSYLDNLKQTNDENVACYCVILDPDETGYVNLTDDQHEELLQYRDQVQKLTDRPTPLLNKPESSMAHWPLNTMPKLIAAPGHSLNVAEAIRGTEPCNQVKLTHPLPLLPLAHDGDTDTEYGEKVLDLDLENAGTENVEIEAPSPTPSGDIYDTLDDTDAVTLQESDCVSTDAVVDWSAPDSSSPVKNDEEQREMSTQSKSNQDECVKSADILSADTLNSEEDPNITASPDSNFNEAQCGEIFTSQELDSIRNQDIGTGSMVEISNFSLSGLSLEDNMDATTSETVSSVFESHQSYSNVETDINCSAHFNHSQHGSLLLVITSNIPAPDLVTVGTGSKEKEAESSFSVPDHVNLDSDDEEIEPKAGAPAQVLASETKKKRIRNKVICKVCKKFVLETSMKRHLLQHSGKRNMVCDVCGKKFLSSDTLNQHKHSHDLEKQFICKICNKAFQYHSHLSMHKKYHHKN